MKYLRSTTLGSKDIEIKKSKFLRKFQKLQKLNFINMNYLPGPSLKCWNNEESKHGLHDIIIMETRTLPYTLFYHGLINVWKKCKNNLKSIMLMNSDGLFPLFLNNRFVLITTEKKRKTKRSFFVFWKFKSSASFLVGI